MSQEIDRLNNQLRLKMDEIKGSENKIRMYEHEFETLQRRFSDAEGMISEHKNNRQILEQKLNSLNNENEELRRTLRELSDANRRITDYEARMTLLGQEVERLNANLRMKNEELASSDNMFKNYRRDAEAKLSSLNNELEESRRKAGETLNVQANRIVEYENKVILLSQEIERLNYHFKESSYEIESIQKKETQYLS